jgi:hypothetical protein
VPVGKLGAVAGPVWTGHLPHGINVTSMRLHQPAKTPKPRPDAAAIKKWRKTLRDAFRRYRIDLGRLHPTATQFRESLLRIKTAARRYAVAGDIKWADRFLSYLDGDLNAATLVRREIGISGLDWLEFKRELQAVYAVHAAPRESKDVARRIAGIDIDKHDAERGPWRDPALFRLVSVLAPVWEEVTGRTAAQSTVDRIEELKEFRFAMWLAEMHALIGVPNPPAGRALDVVLRQKKENPASVQ